VNKAGGTLAQSLPAINGGPKRRKGHEWPWEWRRDGAAVAKRQSRLALRNDRLLRAGSLVGSISRRALGI